MDRWVGRVALVTGASSGIGRAIASRLVRHGMKVVGCARNFERLQELKESLKSEKGVIVPVRCDVRNETEILAMFDRIRKELGGVDVCVNNAGVGTVISLLSENTEKWRELLEVNFLAVCICTREAVKSMRERGIDEGIVININSIAGQGPRDAPGVSFYSATKHAVTTFGKALAAELVESQIRVMDISPGMVKTEIVERSMGKEISDRLFSASQSLSVEDIADVVIYGLSVPANVRISEVIIEPPAAHEHVKTMKSLFTERSS